MPEFSFAFLTIPDAVTCGPTAIAVSMLFALAAVRPRVRGTSLRGAWWCGVTALSGVALCAVSELTASEPSHVLRLSSLRFFSGTVMLTPGIAVLGARRPGNSAWPWFVLLPLVLVLNWSVLSQQFSGRQDLPVEVPTPVVIGFLLVAVMGFGNYFGTLFTTESLLFAAGSFFWILPATEWCAWESGWPVLTAAILFVTASVLLRLRGHPLRHEDLSYSRSLNTMWLEFRDIFGIVWAKRVADRVNQFASREKWNVRLSPDGFEGSATPGRDSGSIVVPERAGQVLTWLLRRFVDDEFAQRFGHRIPLSLRGEMIESTEPTERTGAAAQADSGNSDAETSETSAD